MRLNRIRNFLLILLSLGFASLFSEEIRLHDNTYLFGSVASFKDGNIEVRLSNGETKIVSLEDVIIVRFLGRVPLSLQSGTQEFRFIDGSKIRALIDKNEKDTIFVNSATAGNIDFDLNKLKGFVSLPIEGYVGGKAEDMVERKAYKNGDFLDYVLTQNTSLYPGLVSNFERNNLKFDHEELLQTVPVKISFLAAIRMADNARGKAEAWDGSAQVRLWTRDGSVLLGKVRSIEFGRWNFSPNWSTDKILSIPIDEIVQAEIMGGKVQYLSQLDPVKAEETTVIAPNQPYRMDKNCQGGGLTIGNSRYPWGIGVHSNSSLSFDLKKKFKSFKSEIGLDRLAGNKGSVVFEVLGDGKSLFKSQVMRGGMEPLAVAVDVTGVDQLTLNVTDAGDLDISDIANWVSARVIR